MTKITVSDIDLFIRNLQPWKLVLVFVILVGVYYFEHMEIENVAGVLSSKKFAYTQMINDAERNYREIQKLSKFKSNTIFLMSKLQTLNLLREILTKHNFDYVIYIQSSTVGGRGISRANAGMINVNMLTARTAKMGIYKYIPIKILVRDYVDFTNLLDALKELENKANFVLTGINSTTIRGTGSITLIGKLYVM